MNKLQAVDRLLMADNPSNMRKILSEMFVCTFLDLENPTQKYKSDLAFTYKVLNDFLHELENTEKEVFDATNN